MSIFAGLEISPNSRLRILNIPELAPGKCVLCGAADSDRKYIDFGFQLDWYGAIYFCSECFIEAAEAVGFVPVIGLIEAKAKIDELSIQVRKLTDENAGLRKIVGQGIPNSGDSTGVSGAARGIVGDSQAVGSERKSVTASKGKRDDAG